MGGVCCADRKGKGERGKGKREQCAIPRSLFPIPHSPFPFHHSLVWLMVSFPSTLPIPDEVLAIAKKLEGAGYETWCVGGAVRDNLLGFENKDYDLATAARPDEVQKLFRRTVPVGIEHGTVAVLDRENAHHEVTTFRRDIKTDGRHAVVEFGVELEEDLARRDFTINAIAYQPLRHEWRDPFGGGADLDAKTVRAVGDAEQRFREDYLRILRAVRFAVRFGFEIEESTFQAAQKCSDGLQHLSAERVRDEWFKGLTTAKRPSELVRMWGEVGGLEVWLPEVGERGAGNAERVDRLGADDAVLVTAFLSADPEATLNRLKCSRTEVERGWAIGKYREDLPNSENDIAVRRWMARVGGSADDLVAIALAVDPTSELRSAVESVRRAGNPIRVGDLAITGSDLIDMGLPEGPAVGEVLRDLLEVVLDEPGRNTRDQLSGTAQELIARLGVSRSQLPTPRGGEGSGQGGMTP